MATTYNMTDFEADLHADDSLTRDFWLGLMSTEATKADPGVEFSDVDYGRVAVTMSKNGSTGIIRNHGGPVSFGTPVADWPDLKGCAFFDAETEGNMRFFFDRPRDGNGDIIPMPCPAGAPVTILVDALTETHG